MSSIKVTQNENGGYTASGNCNGTKVTAEGWDWASAIINLLKLLGIACVIGAAVLLCTGDDKEQCTDTIDNNAEQTTTVDNQFPYLTGSCISM